MPVPKKTPLSRPAQPPRPTTQQPGPEVDEQEEEQQRPASRAAAFNDTAPESGINLPVGNYTAHMIGAQREVEGKKEAVKVTYEVYEGEQQGETVPAWYNLFDKDGNKQRGIGFLKRDFGILGQPELDYETLDDQLETLQSERPLCNITVKKNQQWTNIYLQGLAEGG